MKQTQCIYTGDRGRRKMGIGPQKQASVRHHGARRSTTTGYSNKNNQHESPLPHIRTHYDLESWVLAKREDDYRALCGPHHPDESKGAFNANLFTRRRAETGEQMVLCRRRMKWGEKKSLLA